MNQTTEGPLFSMVIISHRKWELVKQCIDSALTQSYPRWELLIVDSGELLPKLRARYPESQKLRIVASNEPEDLGKTRLPVSWVLNEFMGQLRGDWLCWNSDDDLLLPTYFEAFAREIKIVGARPHPGPLPQERESKVAEIEEARPHPGPLPQERGTPHAFYCGELRVTCDERGFLQRMKLVAEAEVVRGPGMMDCQVDGLQFIHDRWLWAELCRKYDGRPWPEELSAKQHADGIFMERAVQLAAAWPVSGVHCMNRRTPLSAFCGKD